MALAHPARRIVALAPHLTELVYAAGAGDRLVAVGKFSDFPPEASTKPVISDAFAVNYEALAQLKPDLVLVWGSGTSERVKAKLRSLGLPVYEIEIRNVAGLADTLRSIGRLAGTEGVAQARAQSVTSDWAALRASYAGRRPVRVFFQLWDAPLMTLNGQHLVSSAISGCGGTNVFAELPTLTATVSWEVAVQRDPELVVTAGSPGEPPRPGRWADFAAGQRHEARRVRPHRGRPHRPQRPALRRRRARAVRGHRPRPPGPAAAGVSQAASAAR